MDKNELEQRALRELGRGQTDRAILSYISILKLDPKDRRIRQKLAETYLKFGRRKDADKQFRQLAKAYAYDGNHRAALSVLTRLVEMNPKDGELHGELARAKDLGGYRKESIPSYMKAWKILSKTDLEQALQYGEAILRLRPDDVQFLVDMAEVVVAQNMVSKGYELYMRAIKDYKRCGQLEDMGRLAVRALEIRPDEPHLLRAAAEACLAVNDYQAALRHLQPAYARRPDDPDVLALLADCFKRGPEPGKAQPVLLELARLNESLGRAEGWLEALLGARDLGASGLDDDVARAQKAVEQARFRLTDLPEVEAKDEAILRIGVRAEVFSRYGFYDRAATELEDALRAKHDPVVYAWAAEVALARGEKQDAVQHAGVLLEFIEAEEDRRRAQLRIQAMGGDVELEEAPDEVDDDEELIDDDETEPPPPAAPAPEEPDPLAAPPEPMFDDVFRDGGTFAEVDPDELAPDFGDLDDPFQEDESRRSRGADMDEAESMLEMGLHAEALSALGDAEGLPAAVIRARCRKEIEGARAAFDELRDVLDESDEEDPGFAEALFVMAELASASRKAKLAIRTLRRLQKIAPRHQKAEVTKRIALLERLLAR
ncbi:MAG TPA: hypothetical protein QGF58_17440 [Myxococcota bacterium]|nr:hypothetical protein [Myxococcota bacterium]